jgi:hypothetical protein
MHLRAVVAGLWGLAAAGSGPHPAVAEPEPAAVELQPGSTPYRSVRLLAPDGGEIPVRLAGPQILVDGVRVNGRGPFTFVMDTGAAGGGRIDVTLVDRLGLESVGSVRATDGTGRGVRELPLYRLESLEVGPLRAEGVVVASRDYNLHAAAVRDSVAGVLGFHLFAECLLTVDGPGRRLVIAPGSLPEPDGAEIVPLRVDPVPEVEVELGGRTLPAVLDTGSMGPVTVPAALAEELPLAGEPVVVGEARTLTGAFEIRMAPLDGALRIGSLTLDRPDVVLGPGGRTNLGGRVLRDLVMTFDQANGRVRFRRGERADVRMERP